MPRAIRLAIATGGAVLATALPQVAFADPSPSLMPPPGCTGGWNTMQAAMHNQAPGTSPGCAVAIAHKK
jgi:hypothetical protein